MNFLAHIFLSGNSNEVLIGNFIGDFVKGKSWEDYGAEVQKGILLHREIDRYTDSHDIVTKTKERLRPKFSHYAPVIGDVFYDHFLASLWLDYCDIPLLEYTESFYSLTESYQDVIPDKARRMLFYMKQDNWLYNYQYVEGINRALTGMSRRTTFQSKMEEASKDLSAHYKAYEDEFVAFFPELVDHSKVFLASL